MSTFSDIFDNAADFLGYGLTNLGLGFVDATEGLLELGNIIPGINYDLNLTNGIKDMIDYEEADTIGGKIGATIGQIGGFLIPTAGVAKGVGAASKLAIRGFAPARASQAVVSMSNNLKGAGKVASEGAKFAAADFLVQKGEDATQILDSLGLENTMILEHFDSDEGDSELVQRLKGAALGFAVGGALDISLAGTKRVARKLRHKETGELKEAYEIDMAEDLDLYDVEETLSDDEALSLSIRKSDQDLKMKEQPHRNSECDLYV